MCVYLSFRSLSFFSPLLIPPLKIYFNRNIRVRKIDLHSTFNIPQFLDLVVLPVFGYTVGGVFIFFL